MSIIADIMTETRTFVMGDIHGAYRALRQCLERADFDKDKDELIQLGDVTDGYPQVYECVETLLKVSRLIALKGNHDEWFARFFKTGVHPSSWSQGGEGTVKSYLAHANGSDRLEPQNIPAAHKTFFERQRRYYVDKAQRCFVHAGFNRRLPIDRQREEDLYWDRELWKEALRSAEAKPRDFFADQDLTEVYIGHTPTLKWKTDQPMQALNIHNLDTGAGHNGRLTIMDVATKAYWQSDPLPQLYPENSR